MASQRVRPQWRAVYITLDFIVQRRHWFNFQVTLALALGGCAGIYPKFPEPATDEYRRTRFVVVQFCLPSEFPADVLSTGRVTRWGYEPYQRSMGGGAIRIRDRTYFDQPVFEKAGAERPIDLLAVTARRNDLEFIFMPPKEIPVDWTEWFTPTSVAEARSNSMLRILNGQSFERVATPPDAPRVRYRLRSYEDEQAEGRQVFRTFRPNSIPSCK